MCSCSSCEMSGPSRVCSASIASGLLRCSSPDVPRVASSRARVSARKGAGKSEWCPRLQKSRAPSAQARNICAVAVAPAVCSGGGGGSRGVGGIIRPSVPSPCSVATARSAPCQSSRSAASLCPCSAAKQSAVACASASAQRGCLKAAPAPHSAYPVGVSSLQLRSGSEEGPHAAEAPKHGRHGQRTLTVLVRLLHMTCGCEHLHRRVVAVLRCGRGGA